MGSQRVRHEWVTELTKFTFIHEPNIPDSYAVLFLTALNCFHHQSYPQLGAVFALAQPLHSFLSYFSAVLQYNIGHLLTWGSSSFSVLSFCLFILFMGFSRLEYWSSFPFLSPVYHILSGGFLKRVNSEHCFLKCEASCTCTRETVALYHC